MLRFDGITIYEMSIPQLERVLSQNKTRLTAKDTRQIEDLIKTKSLLAQRDAKSKRQVDPDFARNNF